jgi:CBS domain-containing protein
MRAGELCTRDVVTASPEESVVAAARRMAELGVGDLIVIDAPGDGAARPLGIVTDRDLAIGVLTDTSRTPADVKVDDVMSRELATAGEDDDVETVLSKMRHNATRRLPVITW